ncbi:DUF7115 domain-containing protein [Halanaeroarchaeum sulfurireducens]|uniref:Uncharacterized protein n=1 Tax=Halanaeroarchaeum sulfurireducens TaxID=1604004 RepID=A0A0F7PBW4_9EURY|nr:PH domain-containing protein [Halanaeroarchaeum sulfurireducens]AKH98207.1 hypothetical protein HLASF_1733 [Halanaeroarchaeum sulfurireducens]ALG82601.1 hypothetical protein HLASA_2200 [Halanaeroarchaeum sulfurireducens]
MDVPTLVSEALGNEEVAAHVPLKGEDALFVTPTRTIRYSAEGLLSDESVSEFSHGAERVAISKGRRKATIELDYGTDGTEEFTVPASELDGALHPVLAGVLSANDVTGPGETVVRTFRFSELTIVVTSDRLIKHIGSAVWDREYEEIPYDSVRGIEIEEGNVSSQFVLRTEGRTQRIKAPNESFRTVRETIEEAILAYYDVASMTDLETALAEKTETESTAEAGPVSFESEVDPVGGTDEREGTSQTESTAADSATNTSPANELEQNGFTAAAETVEPDIDPAELHAALDDLEASIEAQRQTLERQQQWIDDFRELIPDR